MGMHSPISTFSRIFAALLLSGASVLCAAADFPAGFSTREIAANGTTLHVRIGGTGPAVVLIHGYGDTGDMWRRWRRISCVTIRSSRRTCAAWDSATASSGFTKKTRPKTSRVS